MCYNLIRLVTQKPFHRTYFTSNKFLKYSYHGEGGSLASISHSSRGITEFSEAPNFTLKLFRTHDEPKVDPYSNSCNCHRLHIVISDAHVKVAPKILHDFNHFAFHYF